MKTFIIGTSPMGASDSDYFFALGKELYHRGHRVVIVTDKKRPEKLPTSKERLAYYSWPSRRPVKARDFAFCFRLYRRYRPDAVIGSFGATNVMLIIGWLLGIRNRMTYWHTIFPMAKFQFSKIPLKQWLLYRRKKIILKVCATHILTNSNETKAYLIRQFKFSPDLIHRQILLIPDNPMATEIGEIKRENIISFVGRLDPLKGQDLLVAAIPGILKQLPDARFYFVGSGKFENQLKAMVAEYGVEERVVFTGLLSLPEVYEILCRSKVHVSASVFEGFGLVNVEALSAGTPIVARPVGGIVEILEDGENGYYFDRDQERDLECKVMKLIQGDWTGFSKRARRSFVENFEMSNITNQVDDFEKLLID